MTLGSRSPRRYRPSTPLRVATEDEHVTSYTHTRESSVERKITICRFLLRGIKTEDSGTKQRWEAYPFSSLCQYDSQSLNSSHCQCF